MGATKRNDYQGGLGRTLLLFFFSLSFFPSSFQIMIELLLIVRDIVRCDS